MIRKIKYIDKFFKYFMHIKPILKSKIWVYLQLKGSKEKQYADTN